MGSFHYGGKMRGVAVSTSGYSLHTFFISDERSQDGLLREYGISAYLHVEYQ